MLTFKLYTAKYCKITLLYRVVYKTADSILEKSTEISMGLRLFTMHGGRKAISGISTGVNVSVMAGAAAQELK